MPMLNVFIAIIPLLLLSAAFIQVSVIQASLPADAAANASPATEEPLDLTVVILDEAYVIRGNGLTIGAIPRTGGDGSLAQLGEALAAVVSAHPGNREVRIVAQPTSRYEEIVQVMDVARAAGLPETALADAL